MYSGHQYNALLGASNHAQTKSSIKGNSKCILGFKPRKKPLPKDKLYLKLYHNVLKRNQHTLMSDSAIKAGRCEIVHKTIQKVAIPF
jgi:hypothetical protein